MCVCGPDQIPVVTDPQTVTADPALGALSVMAHGDRKEVAEAFLRGLEGLEPHHAPRYYEYAHNMASPSAKNVLEALMSTTDWPVYSPFAQEHFGKGVADGLARAVVKVLRSRGLSVSEGQRARIESTTDQDRLDHWINRVATVASTAELLDDDPPA